MFRSKSSVVPTQFLVLPLLRHSHAFELVVSSREIFRRIREESCVAIVLVDKNRINQNLFTGFLGHYILAFEANSSGEILYYDPDSNGERRSVSVELLERARDVDGTDFDVVFL